MRLLSKHLNSRPRQGAALLGLAAAVLIPVMVRFGGSEAIDPNEPLFTVAEGPLMISVIENGSIQSREKVIVRSTAEGRNTILSIVPEGRTVQVGDLLVELDSSAILERQNEQQIKMENTMASLTQSREKLEVTRNQSQADIEKAELELKFARLNLEKYEAGEYPNLLRQAEADIAIANEELQRAEDKMIWSKKLADSGYITRSELQGDELAKKRAALNLELAKNKLDLLIKYTYVQELEKRRSDVSQAEMALDRVRRRTASDIVQAEADLRVKDSENERQKVVLGKLSNQVDACHIVAPSNGMAVYATSLSGRRWNQEPLGVGQQVIERQELIYLPADSAMMAEIRIHESALAKVREGLPVRITVDALPGRSFFGTLGKIGVLPDANRSWMNPDLKVYVCEVYFSDTAEGLRPGMNCQAEVVIEEFDKAVFVPVQCITRREGKTVAYVMNFRTPEPRVVEVGYDNNRMIHIKAGLQPGEQVLLAPPLPDKGKEAAGARISPPAGAEPAGAKPAASAKSPGTSALQPASAAAEKAAPPDAVPPAGAPDKPRGKRHG
jgi:HlyD family secretion protein